MKFSHTKQAIKAIGKDIKTLCKDVVVTLPKSVVDDCKDARAEKLAYLEWRKAQQNPEPSTETAQ